MRKPILLKFGEYLGSEYLHSSEDRANAQRLGRFVREFDYEPFGEISRRPKGIRTIFALRREEDTEKSAKLLQILYDQINSGATVSGRGFGIDAINQTETPLFNLATYCLKPLKTPQEIIQNQKLSRFILMVYMTKEHIRKEVMLKDILDTIR